MLESKLCLALTDQISVLSASDSIEEMLGFSADDFVNARVSLKELIHSDDSDISSTLFSTDTETRSGTFNIRIRHANGRIRCIRGFYDKHPADTGDFVTLELRLQDVRSLKRTLDDAILMPNFRAMMDNTDDFIYFKDRNHVFTGASQTLVSLCDPAEHWTDLIGQTDYDVFPEEFADIYYRLEKEVFAGIPIAHEIQKTLTKDGKKGWVDNRKYPIKNDNGEIIGLYGIARDITERMQIEENLIASEHKFRSLFEEMSEGVALHSLIRDESGCIINYRVEMINPAYTSILGMPPEQVVGKTATEVYATDIPPYLAEFSNVVESRKQFRFVTHFPTMDKHFDISVIPWESNGFATIFIDITERIKAEQFQRQQAEQFQQSQKLESLGVLAGGIAHDFNNILMAIIGNADLALLKINKDSPIVENLQRIEQAASRAADLARQMLAYSGKGKFVIEHVNINNLLEEMLQMLKISISKKAELRFTPFQPLPSIEADATQMRQIIMNLVINASEAIGDSSGVISITTGCMECDKDYLKDVWLNENLAEGLYVYLEIADTGCGMDKSTMEKLFDPFFTTKFTGRGLGMAAVLGIVRGHKGAIKVYSELNKGTSFKVLLPAAVRPADLFNHYTRKNDWRGTGTVLLVDDEEAVCDIGVKMLKALGFETLTAEDGLEALTTFKENPDISFVILDQTMPIMDGEQCFQELKKIKPDVKVIISSGYKEEEVTQKFVGKGLAGFIQKPYTLTMLKESIRNL